MHAYYILPKTGNQQDRLIEKSLNVPLLSDKTAKTAADTNVSAAALLATNPQDHLSHSFLWQVHLN